ncbi:YeiH family protein [Bacteroides sedimenti]|uniref:Membrane protein n=1 Tax=Bacteroides sedimenti TaxID=2136147 RepID=A0ABM8IAT6_9BACE
MDALVKFLKDNNKIIYLVLLVFCLLPFVTPPVSLLTGLIFALICGKAYPGFNKKMSKYLLQFSVVGLGFGMNLHQALASGKDGMMFTIISVAGTLLIGTFMARRLRVDKKTGYLISSGTAICGGSAIAAVAPVIKANDGQISVSMGTVFILNAIALFLFPVLGHLFGLTQHQFGLWSAIAIHDTSSVVGAGSAYGQEALQVATTVKLTRALWIIPVSIVTSFIFKSKSEKMYTPWFIFFFILAMLVNTFFTLPAPLTTGMVWLARKGLTLTLFFIGASLSRDVLKSVGFRPMVQGVLVWIFIAITSLVYIMFMS